MGPKLVFDIPLKMNSEKVTFPSNYTLLFAELENIAIGDIVKMKNSTMNHNEYDRFVSDIWIGIFLTMMLILIIFCLCSCYVYHKFQRWQYNYDARARMRHAGDAPNLDLETLPNYTLVSGLPSYDDALEQFRLNSTNHILINHQTIMKLFGNTNPCPTNDKLDMVKSSEISNSCTNTNTNDCITANNEYIVRENNNNVNNELQDSIILTNTSQIVINNNNNNNINNNNNKNNDNNLNECEVGISSLNDINNDNNNTNGIITTTNLPKPGHRFKCTIVESISDNNQNVNVNNSNTNNNVNNSYNTNYYTINENQQHTVNDNINKTILPLIIINKLQNNVIGRSLDNLNIPKDEIPKNKFINVNDIDDMSYRSLSLSVENEILKNVSRHNHHRASLS